MANTVNGINRTGKTNVCLTQHNEEADRGQLDLLVMLQLHHPGLGGLPAVPGIGHKLDVDENIEDQQE